LLFLFLACLVLFAVLLALPLVWRPAKGQPLYVQVDDRAENIEWLLRELLRQAPHRHLEIIDHTTGENRRIVRALSRRYHFGAAIEAPPDAPVLYITKGTTVQKLLEQYEKLEKNNQKQPEQQAQM